MARDMIQSRMMRILVISDIHANLVALETVLDSAREYDAVWCLGDVVGYGPAPNECIERLRTLQPICLAGNHDWAVVGKLDVQDFNHDARSAILWTQEMLKAENREWLDRLPDSQTLWNSNITLVHGSLRHPIWEYILSTSIAADNIKLLRTSICLFGHTHVPILYEQAGAEEHVRAKRMVETQPLVFAEKMLINPGSVGQPRDRDPRAAYALLELDARSLTYYRVEYDIAATQAAMRKANLPRRLIERLSYGV